jgi:hypothetical protein
MPIILITTTVEDPNERSRVAQAITKQFVATGMAVAHVTTFFTPCTTDQLYVGAEPLSAVASHAGFALVQVGMSASRPESFRASLAGAITEAFSGSVARTRVSIDFVAREANDVYIGSRAVQRSRPDVVEQEPGVVDQDQPAGREVGAEEVRRALRTLDWSEQILDVNDSTPLSNLFPDFLGEWDSQAAFATADGLIDVLGLQENLFDRGQQAFADALGSEARLADLISYVSSQVGR